MKYDVIIIGGGAAGLLCAAQAGKRGRKTMVIEHNAEAGRKIIISGGGRCNFTNIDTGAENFVSENPHFCKSALARYTPDDFIKLVKKHHIEFYEKKLGQLFCRETSRLIVEMLLKECKDAGAKIITGCAVKEVNKGREFLLRTDKGEFFCDSLVIATGGLSFPKIGATAFGYEIARQFGIAQTETRPALVPLITAGNKDFKSLAGVSIEAVVATMFGGKRRFRENILFTHRGLSGPAVLQISNYAVSGEEIAIDLLPDLDESEFVAAAAKSDRTIENFLGKFLPKRFSEVFSAQNGQKFSNRTFKKLTRSEIESIAGDLKNWRIKVTGNEGYDKAEVTLGGTSTDELSSQTMETKKVPGLYFIGEVVDVTGWLGGYNFQWAWASGYAAGQSV